MNWKGDFWVILRGCWEQRIVRIVFYVWFVLLICAIIVRLVVPV